jgi:putative Mn2+ efflux pump MntP
MDLLTITLTAVALAMDAFAVSVANGVCLRGGLFRHMALFGVSFGAAQAIMPVIGYFIAETALRPIMSYANYIACGVLTLIGLRMLYESLRKDKDEECPVSVTVKLIVTLALATSVDALAVGVSFGLLGVGIWRASAIIGAVAFAFSFAGVYIGRKLGSKLGKGAEIAGGITLVGIGIKMLF